MKKIIIVVGILVAFLLAGMPFITGLVTEKTLKNAVVTINQRQEQNGLSEITEIDRGYLNSKYKFRWTPPVLPAEIEDVIGSNIEYTCDAKHGMTSVNYQCQLGTLEAYTEFVNSYLSGKDPLSINGKVSIFGNVSQTITLDEFTVVEEGETLLVRAGELIIDTDVEFQHYDVEGEFGGLLIKAPESNVNIGNVTIGGDIRAEEDGLHTGVLKLGLAKVESDEVNMKGMSINASSQASLENIDFDYLISVDQLNIVEALEEIELDNLKVHFIGNGLDRQAVAEMNKQFSELANQGSEIEPQQMAVLLPLMESLLKKDLSLWFDMEADYQKQPFKTDLTMTLLEKITLAELSVVAYDPESLLDKMQASMNVVMPNTIIDKAPLLQQKLPSSPLYKPVSGGYQSSIVLQKDNIKLNGESLSFQEFMGLVIQSAL